jgi:hypothetical protein
MWVCIWKIVSLRERVMSAAVETLRIKRGVCCLHCPYVWSWKNLNFFSCLFIKILTFHDAQINFEKDSPYKIGMLFELKI